jgi:hypothetical protein
MNFMKNSLSSGVYLFPPFDPRTTLVGGVGAREGGSGSFISAWGGRSLRLREGSCAVILLIVRRLEGAAGLEARAVKGFGEMRSFLMDGRRVWVTRDDDPVRFDSFDFARAGGGGRKGEGFLTVFTDLSACG